jgi:TldD protein
MIQPFTPLFPCILLFVFFGAPALAQDVLLQTLRSEAPREMAGLQNSTVPAYYLDYRVDDVRVFQAAASFGSVVQLENERSRILNTRVKVGSYQLDNDHPATGQSGLENQRPGQSYDIMPLDDDETALRFVLWDATRKRYREAVARYKAIKANPKSVTPLADFSKEKKNEFYEPPAVPALDTAAWIAHLKSYSALFLQDPDIISADATLQVNVTRKYFVNSEGTEVVQNMLYTYLQIQGAVRSAGQFILPLSRSFFARTPADLPPPATIQAEIEKMVATLTKLRNAPAADPYTGPAILDPQVAGVFFHEIFGHRVEGHRLRSEQDGQTFKAKLNEQVLPASLSVVFDPTRQTLNGQPLNGFYLFDDEGVRSQRVVTVQNGILKTFLMSRSPLPGIAFSNGHGRAAPGRQVVTRQSNLLVENNRPLKMDELRKMLIKECRRQGREYGYYFKDVVGGFTLTDRYNPNAFNIFPTEVYRVYADGRPDVLVQGVDLIGTPLAMFAEITAAGNEWGVFTGFCGAESGSVPVSAAAPALFVRRIETQKKPKAEQEPTLLGRPTVNR